MDQNYAHYISGDKREKENLDNISFCHVDTSILLLSSLSIAFLDTILKSSVVFSMPITIYFKCINYLFTDFEHFNINLDIKWLIHKRKRKNKNLKNSNFGCMCEF